MRRLLHVLVVVSMLAAMLAVPAAAQAVTSQITQSPNTTGMVYEAGSSITVSWVCDETIPANADISLYIAHEEGGGLKSVPVGAGLGLYGSYEVQIPSDGGPYFFHIVAYWEDADGFDYDVFSEAYQDWPDFPWWFTIGNVPTVWAHPEAQTVAVGDIATFYASGDGDPAPSVQWQLDTGSGWADIEGATSESYMTPDATAAMNGWLYRAVYTNDFGSAESNAALLTVQAPAPVAVTISAPTVTPATPKPKRDAAFAATVSPAAAGSTAGITLHLAHLETRRVDGVRVEGWYEYPSINLSLTNASEGLLGGTGKLPVRGEWKMWVTSPATTGYEAGLSPEVFFTAR